MYSMWKYHNEALREHPEYQMEGMMDCLKEEMMMNMPLSTQETPIVNIDSEKSWTKRQWDTVQQLKAQVLFLSDKVNKMRVNASKRKTNRYNIYTP